LGSLEEKVVAFEEVRCFLAQEVNKIAIKCGGEAGSGIMTVGFLLSKLLQRHGLFVVTTNDYPSLIKGGHNAIHIRAESEPIFSHIHLVDVLIALDQQTVDKHYREMTSGGVVLYESEVVTIDPVKHNRSDVKLYPVPFLTIAKELGNMLFFNMAAVGSCMGLIGVDMKELEPLLLGKFQKKGDDVAQKNIEAATKGCLYVKEHFPEEFKTRIEKIPQNDKILITGNDAICLGALRAGCKFIGEYPMSPSSSILSFMAAHEESYNIVVKHTEDEIAAINMIIGAGFAGVRSMTATSGGGFALMTEAIGLAGISETPIVVVSSQRSGPSTGMPTYNEQADLRMALHASQGEFPRVVIAPGTVEECFYEAINAFNLAELLQLPVIILIDKYLSDTMVTTPMFDPDHGKVNRGKLIVPPDKAPVGYLRYQFTQDGISPRAVPGVEGAVHVGTSYEHDETGFTCEDPVNRVRMVDKRAVKLKAIDPAINAPRLYGMKEADLTIIAWGSTIGPVKEALKWLGNDGYDVNLLQVVYMEPFPIEAISYLLRTAKKTLLIEANSTGQLGSLIREKTGYMMDYSLLRYDGRPFEPADIYNEITKYVQKKS